MDTYTLTLNELKEKAATVGQLKVLVGIDGFVDKIVHPVDQRTVPGDQFTAIPTIAEFGARISAAAGKSANIELAPVVEKLGGNGPIMANAQSAQGVQVRYLGALDKNTIHPVFEEFAARTQAVSITDPGITHAAEFTDGKIMLGSMASLDEITYDSIVDAMGADALRQAFSESDCIAMVNWTMIPYLSDVFNDFLEQLLPSLPDRADRVFFFDLADPEKRSRSDLRAVLDIISKLKPTARSSWGLTTVRPSRSTPCWALRRLRKRPKTCKPSPPASARR